MVMKYIIVSVMAIRKTVIHQYIVVIMMMIIFIFESKNNVV